MHAQGFAYWYITGVLTVLGLVAIVACRALGDVKLKFSYELRDPIAGERLRSVLEKRAGIEGLGGRPMLCAGLSFMFFGLLCGFHIVTPAVAYALACADAALILATSFSRVRNRSERRAASLAPRTQTTVVPPYAYAGALIVAMLPLTFAHAGRLALAAILVCAASVMIVLAAWWTASMAAVLAGDDIDLELYVDDRLRRSRVCSMLSLAYAVVPVFFAIATPIALSSPYYAYDVVLSVAFTMAYLAWYGIDHLRGRLPRTKNVLG